MEDAVLVIIRKDKCRLLRRWRRTCDHFDDDGSYDDDEAVNIENVTGCRRQANYDHI